MDRELNFYLKVGDDTTVSNYGYLYNWYAATDVKNIAPAGWHVPTQSEVLVLQTLISESVGGGKLKETGTTHWDYPNTGATNERGFNGRGAGYRDDYGVFININKQMRFWNTESIYSTGGEAYIIFNDDDFHFTVGGGYYKLAGESIRLLRDSTSLTNGQTSTMTDNDGNVLPTICIGTQEWTSCNLFSTKYRNGESITKVTDGTTWAGLTSGAYCAYNNDDANAYTATTIPWTLLEHSPDGYDSTMFTAERSKRYFGVFRSFTLPLKFHKYAGALTLRDEFYTNGFASLVYFKVEKLNKITGVYTTEFTGKVDFSTFKDEDDYVECTVLDGGLAEILKNKDGDEYSMTYADSPFLAAGVTEIRPLEWYNEPGMTYTQHIYAVRFWDMFKAILDKMTGAGITSGKYGFKSTLLDYSGTPTEYTDYFITNESLVKYVASTTAEIEFKTSLIDCFMSLNSVIPIGLGIEVIAGIETIVIEERDYFYKDSLIVNVAESKGLNLTISTDHNFSKIKCGSANKEYDSDANAGNSDANIIEFNTETIYSIPNTTTLQEYDIQSKYRQDVEGMKLIWDTESAVTGDFDNFMLALYEDISTLHHYQLHQTELKQRWGYPPLTSSTNCGNYEFNPKRCITNHQSYLDSICYELSGQNISFVSGTNAQNYNVVYPPSGSTESTYYQYEPLTIGTTGYFLPILMTVEVPYPQNMITLINANMTGYIGFQYRGNYYKGFIQKMEVKLNGRGSVKYTLLSTYDNDLTNLIR
jgi:uncharacterized protein (TIGR02145 family)